MDKLTIKDKPGTPARYHQRPIPYENLDKDRLLTILGRTENPHEYLSCARALNMNYAKLHKAAELLDIGLARYRSLEDGTSLPTGDEIHAMRRLFTARDVDMARYMLLVAKTRTAIANATPSTEVTAVQAEPKPRKPHKTHREQQCALLQRYLNEGPSLDGISTQGQYLEAMRHHLGMSVKDIAGQMNCSEPTVYAIERGEGNEDNRMRYINVMRGAQMQQKDLPAEERRSDFFFAEKMNALPKRRTMPHTKRATAQPFVDFISRY